MSIIFETIYVYFKSAIYLPRNVMMTYHCLQENVSLIKEINDLRRELKIARTQVHDLEGGNHVKEAFTAVSLPGRMVKWFTF